ncbi:MAG: TonB-dependent receptor [Bacteroidota bacterium]
MKHILIFSFMLGLCATTQAQYLTLTGTVKGPDDTPAVGATVKLIRVLDSALYGEITNEQGRFIFKQVPKGRYTFQVERIGFRTERRPLVLRTSEDLGNITLREASYDLEEVEIEGKQAAAQQLGDTTQFNASAYKTNPDASAQDLIEKLPGVIMQNGQVQAQGENVQQVLVDGRRFFGNDPNAALSNLPAEVVDKIQVFDQQSEQAQLTGFDDGQTTKTINIITKVEFRNGTFGKGYVGGGQDDGGETRYKAGGNVNFFNGDTRISVLGLSNNLNIQNFSNEDLLGVMSAGSSRRGGRGFGGGPGGGGGGRGGMGPGGQRGGDASDFLVGQQGGISQTHSFGVNYSDKWGEKWEVSGSYFLNHSDNDAVENLNQVFIASIDSGQVYEESSLSNTQNTNHRFNMRINYEMNSNSSFRIIPRLSLQENNGNSLDEGRTILGERSLNASSSLFDSELSALSFSNTLVWRQRFQKRGRSLSLRLTTSITENLGDSFLNSNIETFGRQTSQDSINQVASLEQRGWDVSTNVMYTEPLGRIGMMQFNYAYAPKYTDSRRETFGIDPITDAHTLLDTALTNTFESRYLTHQVGTGFMLRAGKGFLLTRLNAQYATLDNDQVFPVNDDFSVDFFNLIPMAIFRLRMAKQKDLRVIYRGSTSPPSVTQLQNVLDNSNPLQLSTGNPDLEQSFDNRLIIRYGGTNTEKSTVMFAMLSGQFTNNYIGNATWFPTADTLLFGNEISRGTQFSRPENLEGYMNLRSFFTYGFPVKFLSSNVNLDAAVNWVRTPGIFNEVESISRQGSLTLGLTLSSNISERIDFTISSRTTYSDVQNTIQTGLDQNYLVQTNTARLNFILGPGFVLRSRVSHQYYEGLSEGFSPNFLLWNGGIAKKFMKDDRAELELSFYDLLFQNRSVTRTVSDVYIQDFETNVLQPYALLTFTYNLRQFDGPQGQQQPNLPPEMMRTQGWDQRRP